MLKIDWRLGVNMREFIYYGTGVLAADSQNNTNLQDTQLAALQKINSQLVRVFVPHHRFKVEETITKLRAALKKIKAANMQAILCMDDSVRVSGFFIPEHHDGVTPKYKWPWDLGHYDYTYYTNEMYKEFYIPYLEKVVREFKADPTIFAWELGNELALHPQQGDLIKHPDPSRHAPTAKEFLGFYNFAKFSSEFIKNISPNHLVSSGLVSVRHVVSFEDAATSRAQAKKLFALPTLDLVSIHFYAEDGDGEEQERIEWDVHIAEEVEKPFYVGELGASPGNPKNDHLNRAEYHRTRIQKWKDLGAFSVLPWQFNTLRNDLGISDGFSAMHNDFEDIKKEVAKFGSSAKPFVLRMPVIANQEAGSGTKLSDKKSFQVVIPRHQLYLGPQEDKAQRLSVLRQDVILTPVEKLEAMGLTWVKIEGWVAEETQDSVNLAKTETVVESLSYKVTFRKGMNIRSDADAKAQKVGDLGFGDEIEVYLDAVKDKDYVWRQIVTKDGSSQWVAEKDNTPGVIPYIKQIAPDINRHVVSVMIQVVGDHVVLYEETDTDSQALTTALTRNLVFRLEQTDQKVVNERIWWKVSGWTPAQRTLDQKGNVDVYLEPYDPNRYKEFRVYQSGQAFYSEPTRQTDKILVDDLTQGTILTVLSDSRTEQNGLVWWKISGWVEERAADEAINSATAFVHRIDSVQERYAYKVTSDYVNVRATANVNGTWLGRVNNNEIIQVYADSLTTDTLADGKPDMRGYRWWAHDIVKNGSVVKAWSAEVSNNKASQFLQRAPEFDQKPTTRLKVVRNDLALRGKADHNSAVIVRGLTPGVFLETTQATPIERDGSLWWEVSAWVAERPISVNEDDLGVFLQKMSGLDNVETFRIVDTGQALYSEPKQDAAPLGVGLARGLLVNVDPKSRTKRDDFIWWRAKAWIRGQSIEETQDDRGKSVPKETFVEILPPVIDPTAKVKYRVIHQKGLWVRQEAVAGSTIIGELKFGDEIMVDPKPTSSDEGWVWRKHDLGWSAELQQGKKTYLEKVEEEPKTKQLRVLSDNEQIYIGPNPSGAPLAENLIRGRVLTADTLSRRESGEYVWWQVDAWLKERPSSLSSRADGVFLYPHLSTNVTQYVVDAENQQGIFAEPDGSTSALSTPLKPKAIVDILNKTRQQADGRVWWECTAWVMEKHPANNTPLLVDATASGDAKPTKLQFKVVLRGGLWVYREPIFSDKYIIGELRTGDIVETTSADKKVDNAGSIFWRHSNGRSRVNLRDPIGIGWSAEMNSSGRRYLEQLKAPVEYREYRVNTGTLPVYTLPDENSPQIVESLHQNAVVLLDPDTKLVRNGITWRKMRAWVIERPDTVKTGSDEAFLQPTGNLEKVYLEVVSKGDLWVRSYPGVPTPWARRQENIVGELWTGDVIEAYADSRTEVGGYVWWRHDAGRPLKGKDEDVLDGWTAQIDEDDPENPFMKKLDRVQIVSTSVEHVYQNKDETGIDVNDLPMRDRLFDRIPVNMAHNDIIQHFGCTVEAFKYQNYVKSFQGLHPGIDLGPPSTTSRPEIYAGVTGHVERVYTRYYKPYGVAVRVGPYLIIYGHLQPPQFGGVSWAQGSAITPDTVIGRIGNTADLKAFNITFSPHIHWEIRYTKTNPNRVLNPLLFLPRNLRQQLVRTSPRFNAATHFKVTRSWPEWGNVMTQPVIRLGDSRLIGPLAGE